jgi:hypothetical protein
MVANIDRYRDADLDLGGVPVTERRTLFRDWVLDLREHAEPS